MSVAGVLGAFGAILWAYFIWSKRRFYLLWFKNLGPWEWPFFRSFEVILHELVKLAAEYKTDTIYLWLGHLPFVSTRDPAVVEKILTSPDCLDKPSIYYAFEELLGKGILTLDSPKHTTHRKLLNPAFNHHILLSFFSTFNEGSDVFVQELDKLVDCGELDIRNYIYACILIISIETIMGLKRNQYRDSIVNLIPYAEIIQTTVMTRTLQPWLRIDAIFRLTSMYKPYMEAKKYADEFLDEVITNKLASKKLDQDNKSSMESKEEKDSNENIDMKKSRNIFIDLAIDLYQRKIFDLNDFSGECTLMVNAAIETTSTTLQNVILMLAMHPQYQDKLFEEIVSVFPEKDFEVNYDDFTKLVYMDMVIKETLRIAATAPLIARQAKGDVYISKDLTIPKGTGLIIDIFNMHRRTDVWGPNATSFNPDNFLPENLANKHPYVFIPFSKGSRNCIGWRYADMSLKVILAKLFRNLRFSTKFRFEDLHYLVSLTIKFKVTPQLEVHRR